jgi:hypothetical protein
MTTLPVRCPSCHSVQAIPVQDAQRPIRCLVCGNLFVLPPGSAPPAVALPPHLRTASGSPTPPPVRSPAPPLFASTPTTHPHNDEEVDDEDAEELTPSQRRWRKITLTLLLLSFLAAVCITPVAIVVAMQRWSESPPRPTAAPANLEREGPELELLVLPSGKSDPPWISAATKRASRGGAVVQIERIEVGEVFTRDEAGRGQPAGPGEFFIVHVRITTRGEAAFPYASWYGNQFTYDGRVLQANLRDENDRKYPQQRFSGSGPIRGHTPSGTVRKNEPLSDIIVFAVPHTVIDGQGPLRLELPAGALGLSGVFRFELSPNFRQGLKTQ